MRAFAVLLVAALFAGCTQGAGLERLTGGDAPREPFYEEHRAVVAGEHDRSYAFAVEEGSALVNVTLVLDLRTNGLALPERAPAQLRLELLDAADVVLDAVMLDAEHPSASLVAAPSAPGELRARVTGFGVSQAVDGSDYGAAYLLSIEVAYP